MVANLVDINPSLLVQPDLLLGDRCQNLQVYFLFYMKIGKDLTRL